MNNTELFLKRYLGMFDRHESAVEKTISLNNLIIRFVFHDESSAEVFIRPFQHLIADNEGSADFTIFTLEGTIAGDKPDFTLLKENARDIPNQNLYFNTSRYHFLHNTETTITSLVDVESNSAYYYIDSLEKLPDYEKAAPFRMIFHWICVQNGMSLVHGAAVGFNGEGYMLAGRGGSGKSTLSLLACFAGAELAGDDYIVLDTSDEPTAYSLYNSVKVNKDIIGKYIYLDQYLANRNDSDYDKGFLFINEVQDTAMARILKINGIIIPAASDNAKPSIIKTNMLRALSVIGSSSVFQMPGINKDFLASLSSFIKTQDIFELSLGKSIKENLRALLNFTDTSPLVSVIMPVYNGEDYIRKSIKSVLDQTNSNIELLIIDDGSNDDSAAICKQITDQRIKYIYQDNAGPASARNNGIGKASGRWIAFIDHDDQWYADKLDKQLEYMRFHPELSVVYSRLNLVFRGSPEDYPWLQKKDGKIDYVQEVPSCMFAERTVFDKVGLYDPGYRTAEDSDLHLRIQDAGIGIRVMDEILLDKNIHGANISRDIDSNRRNLPKILFSSVKRKSSFRNSKISVIIPAYNPDRHLISCIRSILAQTLQPYEIIITDDGSKNDVKELLSVFEDPRIKVFRQENKGISGARNFAVNNSTGTILAFIDSDDLWTEEKLELQLTRMLSDYSADAVFGHIRQFYSPEVDDAYREKYFFDDKITKGLIPGTMMISKADFMKVGYFNEDLRLGELFEWIHRFTRAGLKYTVLPDVLMYRRLHYNNNGILNKQDRKDFAKAFAQIIRDKRNENK